MTCHPNSLPVNRVNESLSLVCLLSDQDPPGRMKKERNPAWGSDAQARWLGQFEDTSLRQPW